MNKDDILLVIAVFAVVVSLIGVGFTYDYFIIFKDKLTGFASQSGDINLTVESIASVNFTTDTINWGSGRVSDGQANATLDTSAGADNVTNGNWTGNTNGLVIQNIGNNNVTLNISAGTDAAGLLGGTSPVYEYNISQVNAGACTNSSGGSDDLPLNVFVSANTTKVDLCEIFDANDNHDQIRIDVKLVIPSDSKTGAIGDTISVQIASA